MYKWKLAPISIFHKAELELQVNTYSKIIFSIAFAGFWQIQQQHRCCRHVLCLLTFQLSASCQAIFWGPGESQEVGRKPKQKHKQIRALDFKEQQRRESVTEMSFFSTLPVVLSYNFIGNQS